MQLNFEAYGEGSSSSGDYPLIILHGLFGSLENWRTLSRMFSKCYRVFALDARNHGQSPHSDTMNYAAMADDVRDFMDPQNLSSAYVLGHSMGGKTAMQFAIRYPERVDKLVVVDIAPRAYEGEARHILDALLSINPMEFSRRRDVDIALAKQLTDERLRQFLLKNLARDEQGSFKWRPNLAAISRHYNDISGRLPGHGRFEKPALFISAERSGYITDRDRPEIKALFPYSKIVTVPRVGHWIHDEDRRRFARIVLTFLGQ